MTTDSLTDAHGYAALEAGGALQPFQFQRRTPGPNDLVLDVMFCGICHSDVHMVDNGWGWSRFPLVPGHEIIGRVRTVGSAVTKFKPGDIAGIGCLVGSCRQCSYCSDHEEMFCEKGAVGTYAGIEPETGLMTYGGYSNNYVVDEHFALRVADTLDPAATAPLLCAGITTYAPLRRFQAGPGKTVGVIGLGGLGHMAVKLAKAMGAETVLFTTSPDKQEAARSLGADAIVLSTDDAQVEARFGQLDLILDTVSAPHDINRLLRLLKPKGAMVVLGLPEQAEELIPSALVVGQKTLCGSMIGGLKQTQEMLDFCAEHNITADIELIDIQSVNKAYQRMLKNDVKYRFVIDLASLEQTAAG